MIKSFKHKGLKNFFYKGSLAGINPNHAKKLRFILRRLNNAYIINDLNVSGYRLHPYTNTENVWSIDVNGNCRVLFQFIDGHAYIVDYLDPH